MEGKCERNSETIVFGFVQEGRIKAWKVARVVLKDRIQFGRVCLFIRAGCADALVGSDVRYAL